MSLHDDESGCVKGNEQFHTNEYNKVRCHGIMKKFEIHR